MDGNLEIATYTLIYHFLTKRSHAKAAQAVKKAARDIIALDDTNIEGPQLDTILKQWRQSLANTDAAEAPPSPGSDSESSSSSSSGSSDSSSPSSPTKTKVSEAKNSPKSSTSSSSSSDSSDSSSSDSNSTKKKKTLEGPKSCKLKSVPKPTKASSTSDSSSSQSKSSSSSSVSSESDGSQSDDESSDADLAKVALKNMMARGKNAGRRKFERDSSRTLTSGNNTDASEEELPVMKEVENEGKGKMKEAKKKGKQPEQAKESKSTPSSIDDSESSSTSSHASTSAPSPSNSESDEGTSQTTEETAKEEVLKKRKAEDDSSSDASSSDSDSNSGMDEDTLANAKPGIGSKKNRTDSSGGQVTKKLRTSADGSAISTATTETFRTKGSGARSAGNGNGNNGKSGRKSNTPFQRFDPDKVPVHVVKDNRYEAKAGPSNDYGQRAHQDLIVTRGAGFRKEKNKKKRGSYKGGEISLASHSFKFA